MIRAGIRRVFRLMGGSRRRWEREVDEEITLHLALRAEQLIATGTPSDAAGREAERRFGPLEESRSRLKAAAHRREDRLRRSAYLSDARHDLAFAVRTLRRQKGWSSIVVCTLALGLGATTAVFSVVSSLLIHAVPYPHGDRVVSVFQEPSRGNATGISVTISPQAEIVRAWKSARSFESLQGIATREATMRTTGAPVTLDVARIEPGFPAFAGARPIAGRMFRQDDIEAGGRVVVLSEGFWRTRLGGRATAIGQQITLDDSLYTVIGVLPASLRPPRAGEHPALWLPLDLRGDPRFSGAVGRLRPGVTASDAARELDSIYARHTRVGGKDIPFHTIVISPAKRLRFHDSLILLMGAVALVLLVACANVAHLLLARSAGRQRELAIRAALGAGRWRVFRQLLTESLALAAAGSAGGLLLGWAGMKTLIALRPPVLYELDAVRLDTTTLVLAVVIALGTAVVFGALTAVQSWRRSTTDVLKATAANVSRGGRARARTLLVVSEMALSATLVVGAAMLVRSVINMQRADLGFQPRGLYALTVSGARERYASPAAHGALMRSLVTRLSSTPGIRSVALAWNGPSARAFTVGALAIDGEPPPAAGTMEFIDVNRIGSTYFRTMGTRLVEGTPFTDTAATANQVIINAGFARRHWPGQSAVGHRVRVSGPWLTIVGVAADAKTSGASSESSAPLLYSPAADSSVNMIFLRTDGSADPLAPIQSLVRSIDPRLAPTIQSVEEQMSRSIAAPRFVMLLLTTFTMLALVLAAIGLYGVMSYTVAEQTREIGIRVALGATRGQVGRAVLASGTFMALAGAVVGLAAAAWGSTLLEHQLYGVARSDTASYVTAVLVLLLAAALASAVPTRRALAVDPMDAIRSD